MPIVPFARGTPPRRTRFRSAAQLSAVIVTLLTLCACEPQDADRPAPTQPAATTTEPPTPPPPIRWEGPDHHRTIRLSAEEEALLEIATEQARETLDEARERWAYGDGPPTRRWLTAFRAPLESDSGDDAPPRALTEFLWVEPAHWSAFRIEGWLRSQPTDPQSPLRPGTLVAFPIEDFVDWVMLEEGIIREGGWTILQLENLFGRASPPSSSDN